MSFYCSEARCPLRKYVYVYARIWATAGGSSGRLEDKTYNENPLENYSHVQHRSPASTLQSRRFEAFQHQIRCGLERNFSFILPFPIGQPDIRALPHNHRALGIEDPASSPPCEVFPLQTVRLGEIGVSRWTRAKDEPPGWVGSHLQRGLFAAKISWESVQRNMILSKRGTIGTTVKVNKRLR